MVDDDMATPINSMDSMDYSELNNQIAGRMLILIFLNNGPRYLYNTF